MSALEQTIRTAPLSFAQRRLWLVQQLVPEHTGYHVPLAVRIRGPLDVEALGRAFDLVVERHDALRTTFEQGSVEPEQVVQRDLRVTLVVDDLRLGEADCERELWANMVAVIEEPFDLTRGPLCRARLWRVAPDDFALLIVLHHIICDGWSIGVLYRDLSRCYEIVVSGAPPPTPLPLQYSDYARWQREQLGDAAVASQVRFWREQLAGAQMVLELPADRVRPSPPTFRAGVEAFLIPVDIGSRLRTLARGERVTLFTVLLAGYQALLARYAGCGDVVVGVPVAGRTHGDVESLIGMFVNTLPIRADLSGALSVCALLAQVGDRLFEAYNYQDVPFDRLVAELGIERSISRNPVFQAVMVLQNMPSAVLSLGSLRVECIPTYATTTAFDVCLSLTETTNGLEGTLEYSAELFDAASMRRFLRHYIGLLGAMAENPSQAVNSLDLTAAGRTAPRPAMLA